MPPLTCGRRGYLICGVRAALAYSRLPGLSPTVGRQCRLRLPVGPIALFQLLTAKMGPGSHPRGRMIRSRMKTVSPPEALSGRMRVAGLLPRPMFYRELEIGQPLHPASLLVLGVPLPHQPSQRCMVCAKEELASVQIVAVCLHEVHTCQQLPAGPTIVPLFLGEGAASISQDPFMSVLFL